MPFHIEYPVTRTIRWRWLGPISFLGAFIAIVLLTVLNVALVGYETVNVFSDDFMTTQPQWYHKFMPYRKPKPGSLCDAHLFNVGDRFTTNYTIFEWVVQSVNAPNAAKSGVSYGGSPLNDCDVTKIYMNGDLTRYTVQFSVVMACRDREKFGVTATTSFTISILPGILPEIFGTSRVVDGGDAIDPRPWAISELIRFAATDLGNRAKTALVVSNGATPVVFSVTGSFDDNSFCPASKSSSNCGTQRPIISFPEAVSITLNGTTSGDDNTPGIDSLTEAPVLNIMQTVYAAARIDLGIDSLNNFILHNQSLPLILNKTFPATPFTPASQQQALTSELYANWENPAIAFQDTNLTSYLPLTSTGPAEVQLVYLCRFQRRKSVGSLIISVLVAVLSMFSSGWGAYMLLLTTMAKRTPDSNSCEGHLAEPYRHLQQTPEKFVE
ncbi:hypothetical protein CPB83DRAFT_807004 [Crepidotus variabilis]|uniref:Transmembrane protein n=1 Tax=Crepidotus variabilis TaxID=179855 RepID=A0A9P6EPH8_9AGAR|nr:hypothetical protein CPB83DRAFT_807004 [Crepidotus variabilis]